MNLPDYDLDTIKLTIDAPTFAKAVDLYEARKVTRFKKEPFSYSAVVLGTKPYRVTVDSRHYDRGTCECYLGQNETLCKHMIAVAIYAVLQGKTLKKDDKKLIDIPTCSNRIGELSEEALADVKKQIAEAMKRIKPYRGPSRTWFAYQDSLIEGCRRLSKIVSELSVSEQTAKLLVNLLLRLDRKLSTGGVDDSDGAVGDFISACVGILDEYARRAPSCVKAFKVLVNRTTVFDWEEPLVGIYQKGK